MRNSRLTTEQKILVSLLIVAVSILLLYAAFGPKHKKFPRSARVVTLKASQPKEYGVSTEEKLKSDGVPSSDLMPLPDEEIHSTKSYRLVRKRIKMVRDGVLLDITMRVAKPLGKIYQPTVVLLHGHAENSEVWLKLGTLQMIAELGHVAYAIDIPGGTGASRVAGKMAHSEFVHALYTYLDLDRPLIVAASSSGAYIFDFLFEVPNSINEKISGLIALSPIQALAHSSKYFQNLNTVYTVLMHGDHNADPIGEEALERFKSIDPPVMEIIHVHGGNHLHYHDHPDVFHDQLKKALDELRD